MTHPKRPAAPLLALLTTFSLVAAACGGGDDDSGRTADETSSQSAVGEVAETAETTGAPGTGTGEATGAPVKIGLLYSETGRTASTFSTVDDVAAAWADHVNATKGGAGGHVVEIVSYDIQSDVAVAAEKARQAVEQDGVQAVMVFDANSESAVRSYLSQKGIPMIGSVSSSYSPDQPPTEFPVSTSGVGSWVSSLAAASTVGTHLGYIACSEVPSCSEPDSFFESTAPELGLDYTPMVLASHQEASYAAPCLAATSHGADVLGLAFAAEVIPIIFAECQLQGFDGYLVGTGGTVSGKVYDTLDGIKIVGWLEGFPWWADDPAVDEFNEVVSSAAPDIDYRLTAATLIWASLELFAKVMSDAGFAPGVEVTAADITDAYFQIEGETVGGLLPGPLTFTEGQTQPPVTCAYLFTFVDGTFESITSGPSGNGATGDLQSTCS